MNELVTIIGASYFEPISILLEKLKENYKGHDDEVQASTSVNGYSAALCIMSTVCLESYVMRARYIHESVGEELNNLSVPKFLKRKYEDYPYFDQTNEIFVVRDLLAHNHLIKVAYEKDESGSMVKAGTTRVSSGDKKFSANVCIDTETTLNLGLNTSPILIGYKDAIKVLQTVWKNLIFMENKNRNQCYVSHLDVRHNGKRILFGELIGLEETCT